MKEIGRGGGDRTHDLIAKCTSQLDRENLCSIAIITRMEAK